MRKRGIRGWGVDLTLTVWKWDIITTFTPLVWRMPLLVVPFKEGMINAGHLYIGPIHIWVFTTYDVSIGASIGVSHNPFSNDKLTLPYNCKAIFGKTHTKETTA